jgi:transcriptional regulator with XRE-family HTH domain
MKGGCAFLINQEEIGKFISALRKEKEMTQEQFAEILGVNNRTISRWETGRNMPDLSLLQNISNELGVSVSEILNGRRMTESEMIELRDTINEIIELSNKEKKMKKTKLNRYFVVGILCFSVVLLNHQFAILSYVFRDNISDFVEGALTGLGLLFEFIGLYNNNHDKSFKEKKREFYTRMTSAR